MKKEKNSTIQKNNKKHYIEAHTAHKKETPMEIANEFFDENFIHPLDESSMLADNLCEKLKNDFH